MLLFQYIGSKLEFSGWRISPLVTVSGTTPSVVWEDWSGKLAAVPWDYYCRRVPSRHLPEFVETSSHNFVFFTHIRLCVYKQYMVDCTLSSFAYPIPIGKMGVSFLFKQKLLSLISWLSHCAFCLLCEYQYSHLDFVFSCRPISRVFQIWNSLHFTCLLDRNYVALAGRDWLYIAVITEIHLPLFSYCWN